MRIYLIGYMGSGKTRFGAEMSEKTGYPFIDTDELFESKYRISIVDFFDKYSEETFRMIERDILRETIIYQDAIIATGGGTPCFYNNMEFIKENGISIYLKMNLPSLVRRLAVVKKKRPLLKDKPVKEMEKYIETQIAEREKYYTLADFIVDAETVSTIEICELIPNLSPPNQL